MSLSRRISRRISFLEGAARLLLDGEKIDGGPRSQSPKFVAELTRLLQTMHRFHLVAPEENSFIRSQKYATPDKDGNTIDQDGKLLGQTNIHPLSHALYQDAEHLKSICILKGQQVADFEVLGLDWEKRTSWKTSPDFKTDKVAVLAAGDVTALWQAMNLIRQRENGITGKPIIIQNTNGLWNDSFDLDSPKYKKDRKRLEDLGIYFSSGAPETADLLARFKDIANVHPKDIHFNYGTNWGVKNPLYLFATSDGRKLKEVKAGLAASGAAGRIRMVMDIFGKSEIPEEQRHSFEGNAAEKMEALIKRIKELGPDVVEKLLKAHGYRDVSEVILMTNDGGLGFCMENANGDRETDIFTPEFFPDTYQRMNKTQMAPGVELAYLMRTIGLETAFAQMWKSVRKIVKNSKGKFKDSDLRAYDTSMQMSVPLTRVLDAIRNNEPTDLASLGVRSVFSGQRLKVSEVLKGPKHNGVQTMNYLFVPDKQEVRAERLSDIPMWPNATSFNLLQKFIGTDAVNAPSFARSTTVKDENEAVVMGLLATPSLLFAKSASPSLEALKNRLRKEFNIQTTHSKNEWKKYKDSPATILEQATQGSSNSAYRAGIRRMLDKCSQTVRLMDDETETAKQKKSVLYIGEQQSYSKSMLAKIIQGLTVFGAGVRNQTFSPTNAVLNRHAAPHLVELIEHKKRLGLITQEIDQLITVVDSEEEAAAAINRIVRDENYKVTPLAKTFQTDGQVENKECMTVTVYFSASNVNDALVRQAERLGYLLAVNGMNMKVGGGNDGLMRAAADGFQKGKRELQAKGHNFPNQLILVQCTDTESIEKRYDAGGIYRCHPTIEAREADLQNADFIIAGAGGMGTDEEIYAEFYSRLMGLTNPAKKPLVLFDQQVQTTSGMVGVHEPYKNKQVYSDDFMKAMNTSFALTPEEIIAQAVMHRAQMQKSEQAIRFDTLRKTMREAVEDVKGQKTFGAALADKRFVQPYGLYTGAEGKLPAANEPVFRELKHA